MSVCGLAAITALIMTGLFSRGFYSTMTYLTGSKEGMRQGASTFASFFSSKAELKKRNDELERALAQKDAELADRAILEKENADLKSQHVFKTETGHTVARVVSKPPFTPFDIVVISAGERQGVQSGDMVMLGQTYLGLVTIASEYSSRVTLLSSPGHQEEAFIGDDSLPVLLKGKGGGTFEATVPQGTEVNEGDLVYSYYQQTPYFIGTVSAVVRDDGNTVMTLLIASPFNLYTLTNVEIIST